MSGYLLDTHAVLFGLAYPEKLSPTARQAMEEGPNLLSVSTYWEVALKASRGKLDVGEPRLWWNEALRQLAGVPLALRPEHVERLAGLPPIHNDPFDRMLVAQAIGEGLELVSADEEIRRYGASGLRVVW